MRTRTIVSPILGALLLTSCLLGMAEAQNKPSPSDNMKTFSATDQTGFKENRFRGEVVRVDQTEYVIKTKDGKEVILHRDQTSKVVGAIKQGDMIEAEVDANNHILSVKPFSQGDAEKTNAGKQKQN